MGVYLLELEHMVLNLFLQVNVGSYHYTIKCNQLTLLDQSYLS